MKHGGDLGEAAALHGRERPWLDLSTGINPHAWPVPAGLRETVWTTLPSSAEIGALADAARLAYGVATGAQVVAAPGTQALIQWLPRLAPRGRVAIVAPTYAEHEAAWRQAGFAVETPAGSDGLATDVRHVVVVNPNNPDGRITAPPRLREIAAMCAARGGWLIVDESFADVAPACSLAAEIGGQPIVLLRSFGKFYGLAGLRLGFAIAPPDLAGPLERALGPWAVSGPAIAIGTAALADRGWAARMRMRLASEARELDRVLRVAGLEIVGGTDLFRLARCRDAGRLHDGLARRGIWTRRFEGSRDLVRFGLPPDRAALQDLDTGLREVLGPA